ncbi:acetyl/propionyl/methylcrotonyl-CoA carboxylase subunit alpha [Pseudonocardia sp. WMMC193]|uniref:acetyl-CoA carboxylase biotin carboxylase subunit n=1 Tax=Pseudonocardia sp. WMMC193 TaxID=2911965 RepID=UPI001F2F8A51|nr:biotin carboxylase N-terminal domain-containing protein [Pseudonocardia sp. WMMC193]MCF7551355.1 ATP-grasp domain-containing protein [Pseudonocardia sp. WMMC193]
MRSVFVANRGEIAVRVVRACRDLGLRSVACYADPDDGAPHTRIADAAVRLPGSTAAETYLNAAAVVAAARAAGADAVHPGYGFLSENADFAEQVIAAGLTWVGPSPAAMRALGDKVSARAVAREVGAPMAAGSTRPATGPAEVAAFADEHGLPVAIKAAHGGGGRGLKVAWTREEIPDLYESAVREARQAFGAGDCFVERFLPRARHVEVQVLADAHGTVAVLGTRDCSLQRRHQKLVEEAPAPFLDDDVRESLHEAAAAICRAADYVGAGTVEFLVGADGTVSFLEVNTRVQVEHPVSEEVTGVDIVVEQLRVAAGEKLDESGVLPMRGHALEFRINAEDPSRGYVPSPGTITRLRLPGGPGVRVECGVDEGSVIGAGFDSMIAKIVVRGRDRAQALARARRALAETEVEGVHTVLALHRDLLERPEFAGDALTVHTRWLEEEYTPPATPVDPSAVAGRVRIGRRLLPVSLPGLPQATGPAAESSRAALAGTGEAGAAGAAGNVLVSPMQGTVVRVLVEEGDEVAAGAVVAVVEAMKMENPVRAGVAGVVVDLAVSVGESVAQDAPVARIEEAVPA